MKKIFTLALSFLTVSTLFASAEFFVRINNNGNYTVSLNNQSITANSNIFRFFDLNNGIYLLNIYEAGYRNRLLFSQSITINDGYRTVAEVDKYHGLTIVDKIPFVQKSWYIDVLQVPKYPQYPPVCNKPIPSKYNGWNSAYENDYNNYYPSQNYPNPSINNHPNNYPNNNENYNYGNLLEDASLQSLLQTMKNTAFEDKMIDIAKTALKGRMLSTAQVRQLMQPFVFEKNKLELAIYCYDKTTDKNNYFTLNNDFVFSNYSAQLNQYINGR